MQIVFPDGTITQFVEVNTNDLKETKNMIISSCGAFFHLRTSLGPCRVWRRVRCEPWVFLDCWFCSYPESSWRFECASNWLNPRVERSCRWWEKISTARERSLVTSRNRCVQRSKYHWWDRHRCPLASGWPPFAAMEVAKRVNGNRVNSVLLLRTTIWIQPPKTRWASKSPTRWTRPFRRNTWGRKRRHSSTDPKRVLVERRRSARSTERNRPFSSTVSENRDDSEEIGFLTFVSNRQATFSCPTIRRMR